MYVHQRAQLAAAGDFCHQRQQQAGSAGRRRPADLAQLALRHAAGGEPVKFGHANGNFFVELGPQRGKGRWASLGQHRFHMGAEGNSIHNRGRPEAAYFAFYSLNNSPLVLPQLSTNKKSSREGCSFLPLKQLSEADVRSDSHPQIVVRAVVEVNLVSCLAADADRP